MRGSGSGLLLVALAAFALSACGGSSSPAATPTLGPLATSTPSTEPALIAQSPPAGSASSAPDGAKILEDDKYLADTIGPRPAGTDKEKLAAQFIADRLRSFGYDVSFQEFMVSNESSRGSSLSVATPEQRSISSVPLDYSGVGSLRARLVAVPGSGASSDFPPEVSGNIALITRGELTFQEKALNAQAAGARAAVIFNNESGLFAGSLQPSRTTIPVVAISQAEGKALLSGLERGPLQVDVAVSAPSSSLSRNVIAKPPGRECATVTGGHYDSVPVAPGASDNASGTATVMAIAGVIADRGEMASNCFVLFGGEELGLLGSKYFVNSLDPGARSQLKAMLNLDMVGVGDDGWLLIGNPALQTRAQGVASALGIAAAKGQMSSQASSDHAAFIGAGIPALMLYRLTDNLLHTPQDTSERVRPELLEQAARIGVGFLESLNEGGAR